MEYSFISTLNLAIPEANLIPTHSFIQQTLFEVQAFWYPGDTQMKRYDLRETSFHLLYEPHLPYPRLSFGPHSIINSETRLGILLCHDCRSPLKSSFLN